jgi:phage terminase small subunit
MATPDDNSTPENPGADGARGGLSVKKQAFAQAYHELANATKAATLAGYSPKTAQQIGSRLLKDPAVRAELARLAGKPAPAVEPKSATPAPRKLKAAAKSTPPAPAVAQMLLARRGVPDPDQPALLTTPTEEAFITEYLRNGMNATAAWIFAHPGMPPGRANAAAWKCLRSPRVAARIASERARLAKVHEMTRDQLLAEFLAIVRADPNELTQMRKVACPHCWGPDEKLGRWVDPDPDCEDCAGEGDTVPWIADTRNLSLDARALFAGIKVTASGVQILMHDKLAALAHIGRILGAFEADNKQQQPAVTEAVAQFLGQLHGAGKARLRFVERVK